MTPKITTILFDLGNVMFYVDMDLIFPYWAKVSGIKEEVLKQKYTLDFQHKQFERGLISETEFREHISSKIGYNLTEHDFLWGWNAIYGKELEGIAEILPKLRAKYQLAALSNTNLTHERIFMGQFRNLTVHFHKILCSHHLQEIKPDPEIYTKAIEILKCEPNQILFFDDKLENVEGAIKMGLNAVQVTQPQDIFDRLKKFGVEL